MAKKTRAPWQDIEDLDEGELNPLPSGNNKDYSEAGQGFLTSIKQVHEQFLTKQKIVKTGPWIAVVLKVLSGPQVNNEASTNGGNLSKSVNVAGVREAKEERRARTNSKPTVRIIARIPEIHSDVSAPIDKNDEARMAAHSEFYAFDLNPEYANIQPGSLVWVELHSLDHIFGKSGESSGVILGVYDNNVGLAEEVLNTPLEDFNPPCKALRNLTAPAGGIYRGNTEANPVLLPGPPIRKFKNRILTGLFGNGSLATKANFNRCLQLAPPSFKHSIPGSAPDSTNAFIWTGQLRNNGYMDIVNRPGMGRETIIYAPYSLDTRSPIEIKYYFHDLDGFGNMFESGVDEQAFAILSAENGDSDFKNKIAPAIKDLVKDKRNFVLVIPELMHSKGFGSRTGLSSGNKQQIKNRLSKHLIDETKNLSQVTPLVLREVKSFDGSYTGGKFDVFHQEVLDVLTAHLNISQELIQYISVIGDGMGAITFAAMIENESTRDGILSLVSPSGFQRFDFIDTGRDTEGLFFNTFFSTPGASIYQNLLRPLVDREGQPFQVNYVTEVRPGINQTFKAISDSNNEFVDVENLFKKNNTPPAGPGEQKFTIPIAFADTTGGPTDVVLSFHTTKPNPNIKTGYIFSKVNDDLNGGNLIKSDSNSNIKTSNNKVPDHADASAASQAAIDAQKIQLKISELEQKIVFFETMILSWIDNGIDAPCYDNSPYKIYCKDGQINTARETQFFGDYLSYITNKIDLEELKILNEFETELLRDSISAAALEKLKNQVQTLGQQSKDIFNSPYPAFGNVPPSESLKILQKRFDINDFFTVAAAQDADTPGFIGSAFPQITNLARIIAQVGAYVKIILKIDRTLENLDAPAVRRSPECSPPPVTLSEVVGPIEFEGQKDLPGLQSCGDIKIEVVDNFADLKRMIDYQPDKKRFALQGRSSKVKTRLDEVDDFNIQPFQYKARAANNQFTYKQSFPIWSCITDRVAKAWEAACNASNYAPTEVVNGIRGYGDFEGNTAYKFGMSLHAFGLAFDVDPYLAGYSRRASSPVYSIYTGAWTEPFLYAHGEELYKLGVFKLKPGVLMKNAKQTENELRTAENWKGAPSAYKGAGESGGQRDKYTQIMNSIKGTVIVPPGSNPLLWLVTFCEQSGMRWGNANFLKRRYKNGKVWNDAEKQRIAEIYSIPNVVDRVKALSWKTTSIDDHMHFHFWGGKSLIPWRDIASAK